MKIRLNEIPADGREYDFDRESAELNDALEGLLRGNPYSVKFEIKPIGNAYEMRGSLATSLSEVCSKCGEDFELPVEKKLHEILVEEQEENRKTHSVHGNQSVDFFANGPSMTLYKNDVFDAAEYVHEIIALAEPFYPVCGSEGVCLHADEVSQILRKLDEEFAKADVPAAAGNPAFSVLKNIDLSKKN
jgi:uncharacterized protein